MASGSLSDEIGSSVTITAGSTLTLGGQMGKSLVDDGVLADLGSLVLGQTYSYVVGYGTNARSGTDFLNSISGSGTIEIFAGATISLEAPTECGNLTYQLDGSATAVVESPIDAGNTINLQGGFNTLEINDQFYIQQNPNTILGGAPIISSAPPIVDASISGFQATDRIVFVDDPLTGCTITSAIYQDNILSLYNQGSVVSIFNINNVNGDQSVASVLVGPPMASPSSSSPQQNITFEVQNVACFCPGALISTPTGAVPIESLRRGDLVTTIYGLCRKIEWIGFRHLECSWDPRFASNQPIQVKAHTFENDRPNRTLLLSPDHGIYIDGVIIPIKYLLDDSNIIQTNADQATYYHIKLSSHDVILANNLPCETLLGDISKCFAISDAYENHYSAAEDYGFLWEGRGFAPIVVAGNQIVQIRERLKARTQELLSVHG